MEGIILGNEQERAISKRKEEARNFCYKELSEAWKMLAFTAGLLFFGGIGCYAYFICGDFSIIFFALALLGILGVFVFVKEILDIKARIKKIEYNLVDVEDYVAKKKESQKKIQAIEDERKEQEAARKNEQYQYDHPECPVCKSRNTRRISTLNRAISVGTVGLASSKIGKQYECYHCKHKW